MIKFLLLLLLALSKVSDGLSRCLGSSLSIPRLGFGTYRVDSADHEAALADAIRSGVHLIDTSANYADGGSEQAIGRTVERLIDSREISRCELTIVSKVGYIQAQNLERHRGGLVFPETVDHGPDLQHCIHPDFIRDQLNRTLSRLHLSHLDVYLLHNPEYYLTKHVSSGTDRPLHLKEMLRRILQAFVAMEKEVAEGRILSYGISSNSFSLPASHRHHLPASDLIGIAAEAARRVHGPASGKKHSFSTIQLPANLFETEALKPGGAAWWAAAQGVQVLVNRPLNAFAGGVGWRLADYPEALDAYSKESRSIIQELKRRDPENRVVAVMKAAQETINGNNQQWLNGALQLPHALAQLVPMLRKALDESKITNQDGFIDRLQRWVGLYEALVKHQGAKKARAEVSRRFRIPDSVRLEAFAIRWLLSHSCISTVLVGARTRPYVASAVAAAGGDPRGPACWPARGRVVTGCSSS